MRRQIDNTILEMALVGLNAKRDEVIRKMAEIEQQLRGRKNPTATGAALLLPAAAKPKRTMSAAVRKRMAAAQKKRWAAHRAQSVSGESARSAKPKRRLSAAGRAAIVAATKKRWALKRAAAATN